MRLRHGAEQTHRVRHGGVLEDVVDAGALDGTTGIHDEDVVGRAGHHAQIVGDEHDGGAGLLLRLGEHVEDLRLNRHVEGRGRLVGGHVGDHARLVGDDDVGVVRDGDGDHHALTHTTGELVREAAETLLGLRDADQFEQLDATVVNLLLGHVGMMGDEAFGDLVADGEHRGQGGQRILEHHGDTLAADLAHLLVGLADELLAVHDDGAGDLGVVVEQADQAQRGHGLAGAGLAHDAERTPAPQVEVDASHRTAHAGLCGEGHVQVAHLHDRIALRRTLWAVAFKQLVLEDVVAHDLLVLA